ncbi:VOC family protein [Winogradskya humida]|uniref:Glyoxalase-like domain-containing protein n=1 Tax=Winogradskya humida TaxID=113566 RepID=A0ABQ4A2B0_9ACTN|nr:VOC family protein [Actinoplanes humidus]GIE24994.1 hypothetical protein Ahu01nite_080960 [Actinoplanes humidus]
MSAALSYITFRCAPPCEPYDLALFWSRVLGTPVRPQDRSGDDEVGLVPAVPGGPGLLFVRVPDVKGVAHNRVTLEVEPPASQADEIRRLLDLGAVLVADERRPGGRGRVVLADPVGNEFTVPRSRDERDDYDRRTASAPAAWE